MKLICALILTTFVVESSCRQFVISQVENTVAEIKDKFDAYVYYHADNHTDGAIIPASADMSTLLPRQSTPYWYEEITHQGISAFGPSGYVVYRNVKDYGATGTTPLFTTGNR
jgi:glucan 1,3-beta-glucosidase